MTMNPLPPQAYTKDTLTQAYEWLQSQPTHIKELASNTEILVSLFLKVKMNGNGSLDRPSIQNFKSELKNLAGMIGEFDHPKSKVESLPEPKREPKSALGAIQNPVPQNATQQIAAAEARSTISYILDSKSMDSIKEIQSLFNLSSENEAIRLLISIGHRKLVNL